MNSRVAASERLVQQIEQVLLEGVGDPDRLGELGRLGAQLVLQRAVEDVRGLSDRDIEDLAAEAGLGQLSRSSVSRLCRELRDRYRAFRARSLAGVRLLTCFMDAI